MGVSICACVFRLCEYVCINIFTSVCLCIISYISAGDYVNMCIYIIYACTGIYIQFWVCPLGYVYSHN